MLICVFTEMKKDAILSSRFAKCDLFWVDFPIRRFCGHSGALSIGHLWAVTV